jgi:ribosomal protein S18 acetylase RimI-like enzyme
MRGMENISNDFSPTALAAVIKANLFDYYRYLGRSSWVEYIDNPQFTWLVTGIPDSFMNNVIRTQLSLDRVDEEIEKTLAHFHDLKIDELSWWDEPGTQPDDLGSRLVSHGLTFSQGVPGMAVDLMELNEKKYSPPDLVIERVGGSKTLEQFIGVSIISYGLPESCETNCFNLFNDLGFELPLMNYVGCLDGKPVAAAELFLGAGVVGIYWVSTVPEARGQGIGAAITLAALRDARNLGYRIGILHATRMGFEVYRRLGFKEYSRLSNYMWTGKTN